MDRSVNHAASPPRDAQMLSPDLAELPPLLTVAEFQKLARISRYSAYVWVHADPDRRCVRFGNAIRIPRAVALEVMGYTPPPVATTDVTTGGDA